MSDTASALLIFAVGVGFGYFYSRILIWFSAVGTLSPREWREVEASYRGRLRLKRPVRGEDDEEELTSA
jgi:hypothetical protein